MEQTPYHTYQVCLYVGEAPPVSDGLKAVDLTPARVDADAVLEALVASKLTPADLRARVVVKVGGDARGAVAVYAALLGFAGRRLDVTDGQRVVNAADLEEGARQLKDAGRPETLPAQIQVGPVTHPQLLSIDTRSALSPVSVSAIRFARRVRFVPAAGPSPALDAVAQLVVLAAVRVRGSNDRLPYLVEGTEPAPPEEDPTAVSGLCLDTLRRAGVELRHTLRADDAGEVAEKAAISARQRELMAASAVPVETALTLLGATQDANTGLWHCPRPDRHTHGDANASMRVVRGKVQCFRCDDERVDALRLAMDVLGAVPDEAAEWLLAKATPQLAAG